MLATQVPTLIRLVAKPINSAVAIASLLTSVQNTASNPASSAARATSWISPARQPVPGMIPRPNRSAIFSSLVLMPPAIASWCGCAPYAIFRKSLPCRGNAQQAARQHEMRLVDHLAVERQCTGVRVGLEQRDDLRGPFALRGAEGE